MAKARKSKTGLATDKVRKGGHSLNPDRSKNDSTKGRSRDRTTINRLLMYKNFKPKRNKRGKIIRAAPFQEKLATGTVARVEPNRKWFGNTRTVGQDALQTFQKNLGQAMKDPYQVIMRQTKLPVSLLNQGSKNARVHLLDTESFAYAFGPRKQRKKPTVGAADLQALADSVEGKASLYQEETDRDLVKDEADVKNENPNPLFRAGQSHRVWGELYKVVDSSDVVCEVIDGRDPMGTRCRHVEEFMKREKPHKHLILILNKVDLVPTWITQRWVSKLSEDYPTVAFHASIQHSFGKGALINLLRQFAKVRVENVRDPENHVQEVLNRVKEEYVKKTYGVESYNDAEDFLVQLAMKSGRLLKKGEPDITTVAKMVLNDFQRGKLPYFLRPPGCDEPREEDNSPGNPELPSASVETAKEEEEAEESEEEGSLTDVGSTCSGLSDVSGLSDLDFDLAEKERQEMEEEKRRRRTGGRWKKREDQEGIGFKKRQRTRGGIKNRKKPKSGHNSSLNEKLIVLRKQKKKRKAKHQTDL